MPRAPALKSKTITRALIKLGFIKRRQSGSHIFFAHPDGRVTTVPIHSSHDIGRGLFQKILRDVKLTADEFLAVLER